MLRVGSVLGIGAAALAALWLCAQFFVWEPSGLARGSFVYALKVPGDAKKLRLWSVVGTPLYDVRLGDGPAPAYTLIHYAASGGTEKLEREIAADGFSCERLEPGAMSCERHHSGALEVQVVARYEFKTDSSQVTVHVPHY